VVVSGTYSSNFPKAYTVEVTAENTVTITDTTLWCEYGPSHPVITPVTQAYEEDIPFQLGTTGIYFTITHNITDESGADVALTPESLIDKVWEVRIASAFETVRSIEPYRTAWGEGDPYPRISVFCANEEPTSSGTLENSTKRLQINLLLDVRSESNVGERIEEIFGDILNEIERDVKFYDNDICLAENCEYLGMTPYDADNAEEISFVISFEIIYRNKLIDTRIP
jgi:hypothetical protein